MFFPSAPSELEATMKNGGYGSKISVSSQFFWQHSKFLATCSLGSVPRIGEFGDPMRDTVDT